MVNLIHISDLHYGDGDYHQEYMDNVIGYINSNKDKIDAVVCTGDLTKKGRYYDFEQLSPILKRIEVPLLNVAGNTDVKNSGIIFFEQFFGPRRTKMVLDNKDTLIIGIRSCKDDLKKGEIGDEQLAWVIETIKKHPKNNIVLALHHHLVAVPYAGRSFNVVRDAGELLEITQRYGVDVVLMGHKHIPHAWLFGETTLVYCGTTTTDLVRANDPPCFNEIVLDDEDIEVHTINSKTLEKEVLLTRKRGVVEFIRPRKGRLDHIIQSEVYK
jgi:3',5'-cyclic AMP phosphodiesterase CpdA